LTLIRESGKLNSKLEDNTNKNKEEKLWCSEITENQWLVETDRSDIKVAFRSC